MVWHLFLASLAALVFAGLFVRRLRRWFVVSGCIGLLVAFTLVALPHRLIKSTVLLVLWPPSIAGLADPSTTWSQIIFAVFEFGGNFVLYGAVGTLVGLVFRRKPNRPTITGP
jgi:hypothetical protein